MYKNIIVTMLLGFPFLGCQMASSLLHKAVALKEHHFNDTNESLVKSQIKQKMEQKDKK